MVGAWASLGWRRLLSPNGWLPSLWREARFLKKNLFIFIYYLAAPGLHCGMQHL